MKEEEKEKTKGNMFPLFTTIYQATVDRHEKELKKEERIKLCQSIDTVDQEGNDLIFAIIQQYYQEIDMDKAKHNRNGYAYSPKNYKRGLKYDMSSLPLGLLHMINYFIDLHIKKINEDEKRDEESLKMNHKKFMSQLSVVLPEKSIHWFLHYLQKNYKDTPHLQEVSQLCLQFDPSAKCKHVSHKSFDPSKSHSSSHHDLFLISHDKENKIKDILFFFRK
jgi:hypothetical protein